MAFDPRTPLLAALIGTLAGACGVDGETPSAPAPAPATVPEGETDQSACATPCGPVEPAACEQVAGGAVERCELSSEEGLTRVQLRWLVGEARCVIADELFAQPMYELDVTEARQVRGGTAIRWSVMEGDTEEGERTRVDRFVTFCRRTPEPTCFGSVVVGRETDWECPMCEDADEIREHRVFDFHPRFAGDALVRTLPDGETRTPFVALCDAPEAPSLSALRRQPAPELSPTPPPPRGRTP